MPRSFCVTPSAPARVGDTSERGQVVLAHPNLLHHCSGAALVLVCRSTVWCSSHQHQVSHPRPDWCSPWTDATRVVGPNHRPMTHLFSAGQMPQPFLNNCFRWKSETNFSGTNNHLECSKRPKSGKDSGAGEISLEMWGLGARLVVVGMGQRVKLVFKLGRETPDQQLVEWWTPHCRSSFSS